MACRAWPTQNTNNVSQETPFAGCYYSCLLAQQVQASCLGSPSRCISTRCLTLCNKQLATAAATQASMLVDARKPHPKHSQVADL
jgi:hypothetical protein